MTSINNNPYAYLGSAYARAGSPQASSANTLLNAADSSSQSQGNGATNLTLSEAARARLTDASAQPDFATLTGNMRAALDKAYAAAKVTGPIGADGKTTVDLPSFDRRSLFAVSTNNGGKFSPDEQKAASTELSNRFNDALAPAVATSKLTGNFNAVYNAALDYLDGASGEEKATAVWSALHTAVSKGVQATRQDPTKAPTSIANDPVAAYLSSNGDGGTSTPADFSTVAKRVRATLDAQAKAAAATGNDPVFDPGRKAGQQADFSGMDSRSLAAVSLNQDGLFSKQESFAAKQTLDARNRASILAALNRSQSTGDPTQLSLGILNTYSSMSAEERQASNWTPTFRDHALANYKSSSHIMAMLRGH